MPTEQISAEALLDLHRRLAILPPRSHERRLAMGDAARLYGVSELSLYHMKALAELPSAEPAEIRLVLRGQLATGRTQELHNGLLTAGIPLGCVVVKVWRQNPMFVDCAHGRWT